ncbi:MAG: RNase J family beta-CASP ribonuclease [Clostridia bacterium]|nr:RNase J family beta-CASP ribonuclease [Clostridia bacterium]
MPENSKPKSSRPAQNAPGSVKAEPHVKQSAEAQNQRPSKKTPPVQGQVRPKSAPKPSVTGAAAPQPRSVGKHVSGQQQCTPRPAASPSTPATSHKPRPATGHQPTAHQRSATPRLKVIPLGGMREIGKNMTVYEYGDDMIIVDCGIAFPAEDMPGIDVVIPDFSYVINNRQKLRGIFITHGHEDHIGALPYLLKDIKVPVYANHLTIELISRKIEDRGTGVKNAQLIKVSDGDVVGVGNFSVEFIHVNHSIEDANALVIRTPAGIIYHSGDFKIDHTPIHGKPMDLTRIGAIGDEGVLLMVCESTNVEKKGYTPSERKVGDSLAELFGKAEGRIFVTTFSSNVSRVQQIFTAAERYNRKVALIGRSMVNVFDAANSLGYIDMQPDTLIDVNQIDRYPADKLVLITTGSQGEPMSALTRMAFSEHRTVEIVPGDTVILSSSAIPGNEKSVYRVINELYRRGAHVIYESLSEIHVSGHAYQEELKLLHNLVRPRFFIPAHGEYRHLYRHAELANQLGSPWESIFVLGNGDIFEFAPGEQKADISGFVQAEGVLIDGSSAGFIDNLVLKDRRLLSDDGVVAIFIAVDDKANSLVGQPDIQTRGFMYESESERIILETQKKIAVFAHKADQGSKPLATMLASNQLKDQLRDLLFERTRRRPVILVSVLIV